MNKPLQLPDPLPADLCRFQIQAFQLCKSLKVNQASITNFCVRQIKLLQVRQPNEIGQASIRDERVTKVYIRSPVKDPRCTNPESEVFV